MHPSALQLAVPKPAISKLLFRVVKASVAFRYQLDDRTARWAFIAAASLIAGIWLWALGVSVAEGALLAKLELAVLLLAFATIYRVVGIKFSRLALPMSVASDLLFSLLQILALIISLLPLTYLAATVDFPLLDGQLARLDALLFGFDWQAAARWIGNHPVLDWVMAKAYRSIDVQCAAVLLLGSIARPGDRNGDFFWQSSIALALTSAVFVFTPALGECRAPRSGIHRGADGTPQRPVVRARLWSAQGHHHVSIVPRGTRDIIRLCGAPISLGPGDLRSTQPPDARVHDHCRRALLGGRAGRRGRGHHEHRRRPCSAATSALTGPGGFAPNESRRVGRSPPGAASHVLRNQGGLLIAR